MRHEIYCQKYGVQEHNGAEYFIFLERCPSQKDFCFNSSVISLSWSAKSSMPMLPSCPAKWTDNSLGRFSKLVPCRCSFAQGDHSGAITGGWEALRCKGESCQGLFFQLWGITSLLSWCPDLENTEVQIRQTDWLWWATHMTEHCRLGAVWRTMDLLRWFSAWWSQCLALRVPVVQHPLSGWFLQACLKTNPSTWIRACCFASLFLPPSQLTRDNWEHKSLLI